MEITYKGKRFAFHKGTFRGMTPLELEIALWNAVVTKEHGITWLYLEGIGCGWEV